MLFGKMVCIQMYIKVFMPLVPKHLPVVSCHHCRGLPICATSMIFWVLEEATEGSGAIGSFCHQSNYWEEGGLSMNGLGQYEVVLAFNSTQLQPAIHFDLDPQEGHTAAQQLGMQGDQKEKKIARV